MKRIVRLIPCVLIVIALSLFAFTACSGVETMEIGTYKDSEGFVYSINKIVDEDGVTIDHFAKVIGYEGEKEMITVPASVHFPDLDEDISVTIIAGLAFYNLNVKNVIISEGITKIDNFAFGYSAIMGVDIPSTIEYIGDWSFVNCKALKEVIIRAETSPELGTYAFKYYDADGSRDYEVNPGLKIKVPSISAYQTDNVLNNWIEYQDNLEEV